MPLQPRNPGRAEDEPSPRSPPARGGALRVWAARAGRHELSALVGVAIVFAVLWGLAELAQAITRSEGVPFDARVLRALRQPGDPADPLGPRWLEEAARDVTALGSPAVLGLICASAIIYLLLQGKWRHAGLVMVAISGGFVLNAALKQAFDRPRPDWVAHLVQVESASYPSGHAMASAIAFLTLGGLLARAEPRWHVKAYLLVTSVSLTVLVGATRVYLGVHWPTDVFAGWTAGAAWALACRAVMDRLERRGALGEG